MQKPRVAAGSRISEYPGRCEILLVSGHRREAPLRCFSVGGVCKGDLPLARIFFYSRQNWYIFRGFFFQNPGLK